MNASKIEKILLENLSLTTVHVQGENAHYTVIVVSDELAALPRLKQQQTIYAPLMSYFSRGDIHALSIRTFNQEQWQRECALNVF